MPPTTLRVEAKRAALVGLTCFVASAAGCYFPLLPDPRTVTDRARSVERKCKDYSEGDTQATLSPDAVDSVEGLYAHVKSGTMDPEPRLRGARIHVRPLAGLSKEGLERRLECHESRVVLGQVQAAPSDPYVLPDHWLDIDVDSEGDGFVVLVQIDEFDSAKTVLERARRFFDRRQSL